MQVPNTPADAIAALPQRSGPTAVTAVAAVQALPEQAKNLDTRLALQAVQPNQAGEAGTRLAQALLAPAPQLRSQSAVLNWLTQSGATSTAPSASVAAWLATHFSHRQATMSLWPVPTRRAEPGAGTTGEDLVQRWLTQLQAGLLESGVFTAHRLGAQFFRPADPLDPRKKGLPSPSMSAPVDEPIDDATWMSVLKHLAPESDAAKLAGHMLVSGQLVWSGELAPGIPLRVTREDAWESDPETGEAVKGVALHLQLSLPRLGPIEIRAQFIRDQGEVHVSSPRDEALDGLRAYWAELQQTLQSLHFRSTLTPPSADA